MAARGTERRAMPGAVLVRLPSELAAWIGSAAAAENLSAAAYLRRLAAVAAGTTPELARPSPPRRPLPPPPSEAVVEVARLREVVGELAGAMVQAAIRVRTDGAETIHAEIEATLPGIRAAARDLDRVKLALLGKRPQ